MGQMTTHHCWQAITPEETLRAGPALEDEVMDGSVAATGVTDVGECTVSAGEPKGGWGTGAFGIVGGWERWKCEGLI
jgi:hypothetical protein